MRAEILAVGTEILLGDIVNTNGQYIARRLADMGIAVYHQSVIGDNPERLKEAYELAFKRAELVITTGGLGPTRDDLTKEIAGEFFNKKLVLDKESLNRIEEHFTRMGQRANEGNRKQAYFPEGCTILRNDHGTAPGCIIDENGKILILMPGPPREMVPMFENGVVPYLERYQDGVLVSRVLKVCGIGEGHMEEMILDIINSQTNPTIAPYAKEGEVIIRITAKVKDKNEAKKLIEPVEDMIRQRLGENIYGVDDDTLESVAAELLINKRLTISTAESCTGGLIASRLINYPGVSSVFMEGAVTYSNEAKMSCLGVKAETLEKYGAVSSQTAVEMAEGIARTAKTDVGISVTGIAGPGGGTHEKPVGLVYLGLYIKGSVKTMELNLSGDRQYIRNRTVVKALDWLRRELLKLK